MTSTASGAYCDRFLKAEEGTTFNEIFKNHMKLEDSCIGTDDAKELMVNSHELYTTYYQSYGQDPCSSMFFEYLLKF